MFASEPVGVMELFVKVVPTVAEEVMKLTAVAVVVAAIEPGAMKVAGVENVKVFNPPVVVIWLAVPAMVTDPVPLGTTGLVPASGTNESIATPPPVKATVSVEPLPVTVTPEAPKIFMLPAVGLIAPPLLPVKVARAEDPPPKAAHVGTPETI